MRIKVSSSESSFSSLFKWPSLSNEKYTSNLKNICKWTLIFIPSRCFLAPHQSFQWTSRLAKKFSNSLQPLPDAPMNIYERFSSAEGELKIYDVWLMIILKIYSSKIYDVCLMSFSSLEGELKIYDVGLMVRRLQRKKRNISKTPDKEITKIWLEN